jgi:hypothetical protein
MQGIQNPKPKQQWDIDMIKFLKSIPTEDNILLLIDTNNDLQNHQFGNFVANLGLYDLIGTRMGYHKTPTYIQGKRTID